MVVLQTECAGRHVVLRWIMKKGKGQKHRQALQNKVIVQSTKRPPGSSSEMQLVVFLKRRGGFGNKNVNVYNADSPEGGKTGNSCKGGKGGGRTV